MLSVIRHVFRPVHILASIRYLQIHLFIYHVEAMTCMAQHYKRGHHLFTQAAASGSAAMED